MRRSRILFALLMTVAACGGSHKSNTTDPKLTSTGSGAGSGTAVPAITTTGDIPAELQAKVEKALSFVDALTTAAEKSGPDCNKIAAAMKVVADGPDGSAVKDVVADKDYETYSKAIDQKYEAQSDKIGDRMKTAVYLTCFKPDEKTGQPPAGAEAVNAVLVQAGLAQPDDGANGGGDGDGDTDEAPPASNE